MITFTSQEASIYVFAMRYALPRDTGAAHFVTCEIAKNWDRFTQGDKWEMHSEIKSQLEATPEMLNRGDWERILAL